MALPLLVAAGAGGALVARAQEAPPEGRMELIAQPGRVAVQPDVFCGRSEPGSGIALRPCVRPIEPPRKRVRHRQGSPITLRFDARPSAVTWGVHRVDDGRVRALTYLQAAQPTDDPRVWTVPAYPRSRRPVNAIQVMAHFAEPVTRDGVRFSDATGTYLVGLRR